MKKSLVFVMLCLQCLITLAQQDVYKKGAVKLAAVAEFARGCNWPELFLANRTKAARKDIISQEYMAIAPDGKIYIVESTNSTSGLVFKFDADGKLLNTMTIPIAKEKLKTTSWGRHLEMPTILNGSELLLSEYSQIDRCDLDGQVKDVLQFDYSLSDIVALKDNMVAINGWIFNADQSRDRGGLNFYKSQVSKDVIVLKNMANGKESTLIDYKNSEFAIFIKLPNKALVGLGYRARTILACTPDGNLVTGFSDSPEIQVFSPQGQKKLTFTVQVPRQKIDPQVIAQAVQRISKSIDELAVKYKIPEIEIAYARNKLSKYPAEMPYYSNITVDDQGNILVFLYDKDNNEATDFLAYTPQGKLIGKSRFITDNFSLRLRSRKQLVFHQGHLYALIKKQEAGKTIVQLAKFKLE